MYNNSCMNCNVYNVCVLNVKSRCHIKCNNEALVTPIKNSMQYGGSWRNLVGRLIKSL